MQELTQALLEHFDIIELQADFGQLLWTVSQQTDAGSCIRLFHYCESRATVCQLPWLNIRSRIYHYGGGSLCWISSDEFAYVDAATQQIYLAHIPERRTQPLTATPGQGYGNLSWHNKKQAVIAIREHREISPEQHELVSIDLYGNIEVLDHKSDFYAAPSIDQHTGNYAFLSWNHPEQPWTQSSLCWKIEQGTHELSQHLTVSGLAWMQPRYLNRQLYCLAYHDGFLRPHRLKQGQPVPLAAPPYDHVHFPWNLDISTWLPLSEHSYLAIIQVNSLSKLILQQGNNTHILIQEPYSRLKALTQTAHYFYLIAYPPDQPPEILQICQQNFSVKKIYPVAPVLKQPAKCIDPGIAIQCGESTHPIYGFFYRPAGFMQPGHKFPLMINLHGGPVSTAHQVLDHKVQFWLRQGFAYLDLNYRGSVGFGQAYYQALKQQWGIAEVTDLDIAIQYLFKTYPQLAAERIVVRGSSAGGFSALNAACQLAYITAVASYYGISDLKQLLATTHKFEAGYLHWLIGDPAQQECYQQRSVYFYPERLQCPVIFFQGLKDQVVPAEQTQKLAQQLHSRQGSGEAHYFSEEGHGFSELTTILTCLEKEARFYRRLGITSVLPPS